MQLFLISVLAIASVRTLSIGYPSEGFLVYMDNSGIERIVSFNYAEPVYAIQRLHFAHGGATAKEESSEANTAREAHFRAWSLQQYQVLKREIDFLRGEGKEPSPEMLLKFLPLEKIALTSDFSKIAELPEIRRIRNEHLNIWNTQVLLVDEDQIKSDAKTTSDSLASGHHSKNQLKACTTSEQGPSISFGADLATKIDSDDSGEAITKEFYVLNDDHKAKVEATLKLLSEVPKLISTAVALGKENLAASDQQVETVGQQISKFGTSSINISKDYTAEQFGKKPVADGNKKLFANEMESANAIASKHQMNQQIYDRKKIHSEIEKIISTAAPANVPQLVADTVEMMRARDEHLKIINDAVLKAKLGQVQKRQMEISTILPNATDFGRTVE